MLQRLCSAEGNKCARSIKINKKSCLVPCEGVFADVQRYEPDGIDAKSAELFEGKYHKYKSFFEKNKGNQHRNT